ncbi:L-serine ammonia-lyase, iron-sulfur-dependent, subunit alpha [Kistimonas scapharcae]|uniref:UPF0597 protein GCM10023116_33620 n=1 Tax=Kistimonas scapharcae TaxID=1036133 RepID=A0ABP8V6A3_9GAMM
MWRPEWEQYIRIINDKVVPSLGCTEPISTAYATALAVELLNRTPEQLTVLVSGNLMKNGMGVGVPGTGMVGLPIAAAVGAIGGDPDAGLEVLKDITSEHVSKAKLMVEAGHVSVAIKDVPNVLYTEVQVCAGDDNARVIIKDHHTQVVLKELNGKPVFEANSDTVATKEEAAPVQLTVADIYEFATQAPFDRIRFILESARLNKSISAEGLEGDYGLKVGKTLKKNITRGYLSEDLAVLAMMRSSAASDARMDGVMLPAMSNSGSGNQGIAATMPVVAVAERLNASEETLARALILSHLTAIHIKSHLDTLSALCGATTAGTGASAAITWLLGGDQEQIQCAIFNMVGDITGIFCDGAKTSCSLKVSTAANAAVKAALLAMDNIRVTRHEGIIEEDVEKTIANLGMLGNQGMKETDRMILKIMTAK